MGLFASKAEREEKKCVKLAEKARKAEAAKKSETKTISGKYDGSLGSIPNRAGGLFLHMNSDGVEIRYRGQDLRTTEPMKKLSWTDVYGYDYEVTQDVNKTVSQRVTATRMIGLGVFALAAPKKTTNTDADVSFIETLYTKIGNICVYNNYHWYGNGAELNITGNRRQCERTRMFVKERAKASLSDTTE